MTIQLIDINPEMVGAWRNEFGSYSDIKISTGSIFELEADAIVSPANSFGIMDGGLDGKIRDFFSIEIEEKVRQKISLDHAGELPVGVAISTSIENRKFRYLITAPTMRVPEIVASTQNAYLAMRAILLEAKRIGVQKISIPGLCALSGQMPVIVVARQMRIAYDKVVLRRINYTHWREEKALQNYMACITNELPFDYENKR